MDTNGSIATTHYAAEISIKSLHVQDKGTFELKSYHHSYTWGINATNITVLFSHIIKIQSSGTERSSLFSTLVTFACLTALKKQTYILGQLQ